MIWYEDFGHMDDGLGRGGQLKSFEAVFSPLDSQGSPLLMWTRDRGDVIPSTVKYWVSMTLIDSFNGVECGLRKSWQVKSMSLWEQKIRSI